MPHSRRGRRRSGGTRIIAGPRGAAARARVAARDSGRGGGSSGGGPSVTVTPSGTVTSVSFNIPIGSSRADIKRIRASAFQKARRGTARKIIVKRTLASLRKPVVTTKPLPPKKITSLPIRRARAIQRIKQKIIQRVLESPQRIAIKREQLRQERSTLIRRSGVKALFSPRVKKIDKQLRELTLVQTGAEFGIAVVQLPSAVIRLIKNPKNIKKLPSSFKEALIEEGKETGKLLLTSPGEGIVKIGTEIFLFKGTGKALRLTGKVSSKVTTRLSPKFRGVKTTSLGIQEIKGVKKVGDIQIIPPRGVPLDVKPLRAVAEAKISKQLKPKPSFPKTTPAEKRILKVVKKREDTVVGSFSQQTLLKKQFTRKFKDLDIATKNRPALIKALKKEFGKKIKFKKKLRSIQVIIGKKKVADLIKFKIAEEGFVKKLGITTHRGLKLAKPESRLAGKVSQLRIKQLPKTKKKVIKDIRDIFGKKVDLNIPAIRGGFGFSKKELRAVIGKKGPITTAQVDLLGKGIFKPNQLKLRRFFFASPFNPKTGKAQVRTSRLGISKEGEASFMDLLMGDFTFKKAKPQIFVFPKEKVFGKVGKISHTTFSKTKKGFVVPEFSSELEVILGKGWAIKRGKTLATTIIEGKRVPIIELKRIRLSKTTRNLVKNINTLKNRLDLKKISKSKKAELLNQLKNKRKKLNTDLKKQTGFDHSKDFISSRKRISKKFFPVKRKLLSSLITRRPPTRRRSIPTPRPRLTPRGRPTPRPRLTPRGRPTPRPRLTPRGRPTPRPRLTPRGRPTPRPRPGRGGKPPIAPRAPPLVPRGARGGRRVKKRPKKQQAFKVLARPLKKRKGQKRSKLIKVSKVPLSKQRAEDLRNFISDQSLARTSRIKPTRGKPQQPRIKVPTGYSRKTSRKFRTHRTFKKKRIPLPKGKIIEKSRFLLDTRSEKKGITLRKKIAELERKAGIRKPIKKKRIITTNQRSKLLKNLVKARAIRIRNLKRR